MAYIVVVNPQILSQAGVPVDGVVFATCISAAAATLVMGLYANYPIALAPGMSLNAYFTYVVCLQMHVPWRTALGVIFFSGIVFLILTVTRIREQIVNGIPNCLKHSTAGGIGMFIAFVGLRNANLVVANPATFVSLGSFRNHDAKNYGSNLNRSSGYDFDRDSSRHVQLAGRGFLLASSVGDLAAA
jgi:AGZA family xanthine/uracil permease-like MFS transporter